MSDSTKNRSLVSEALESLLPKADAARALNAWAAAFESKPTLVPSIVAGHIAKALDRADVEEAIRTRLTQIMLREHGANASRGGAAAKANKPVTLSSGPIVGNGAAGCVVFRAMLAGIVERARELLGADAAGIECEWRKQLENQRLTTVARQAFERWCQAMSKGTNTPINGDITTEDMKTVVHGIYVWCCEALGPVEADRIFADTIEAATGLPEARGFAPTQLL
jgi:hypothetical protein